MSAIKECADVLKREVNSDTHIVFTTLISGFFPFVLVSCFAQVLLFNPPIPSVIFILTIPRWFLCCSSSFSYVAVVLSLFVSYLFFLGASVWRGMGRAV